MSNDVKDPPDQTAASLVSGILGDLQHLVEQQFQLTRREIEDEIRQRAAAAAVFALGVTVVFLGAIVFCLGLAHLLHWATLPPGTDPAWLPLWACHAVVAAVLVVIGGFVVHVGRAKFRSIDPVSQSGHRNFAGAYPMSDTAEMIREQMDETKSQLSDKLESLEHQVSETVQSTGTAVNATVEAVQETVETVTGAVQDAVQSVSNAFDFQRQIDRHPWLVLGGSVVLGYLAVEFLTRSAKKSGQSAETTPLPHPSADNAGHENGEPAVQSAATGAAIAAAYESGLKSSSWHQLRSMAIGALIGIAQDVASRAVPHVMNYLNGKPGQYPEQPANGVRK